MRDLVIRVLQWDRPEQRVHEYPERVIGRKVSFEIRPVRAKNSVGRREAFPSIPVWILVLPGASGLSFVANVWHH